MHKASLPLPDMRRLTVLVAEDEFLIALDLEMILQSYGHSVAGPVGSIEGALALLEDGRPDVAVLDVNLRGKPVVPVARRLLLLHIPFVLASAYRTFDFEGAETLTGADNIGKPIFEHRLLNALDRAVTAGRPSD